MTDIDDILLDTRHRPFEIPQGNWAYYQEWNNALFLHWKVSSDSVTKLLPGELNLDTFNGNAYISVVAFTMQRIRPRNLPAIKFISDFDEINVRTYIDNDGKKGVYFLNIEAEKQLSVFIAKALSGLPYEKSHIHRTNRNYKSTNRKKGFYLDTEFHVNEQLTKTPLDNWLTERYCLYLDMGKRIYRYDIHHKEWKINNVDIKRLNISYHVGDINLANNPDLTHYSDGVKVIAWKRTQV